MTPGQVRRPLSRRGKIKLAALTTGGILSCMAVALVFNLALFHNESDAVVAKALVSATLIPVILAGPLFVFISLKLRQLSLLNRELKHLAAVDSLTTLLNRGAFSDRVESRLSDMRQNGTSFGALLLIDADFFKEVNDRWGHAVGDEVLREIALRLQETLGEDDLVGRLGGEEFAVFLPGANRGSAAMAAERLRLAIGATPLRSVGGEAMNVSISVGGVVFRSAFGFDALYRNADRKLYEAKDKGRNRVEIEEMAVESASLAA